jgi:hypothetical protein
VLRRIRYALKGAHATLSAYGMIAKRKAPGVVSLRALLEGAIAATAGLGRAPWCGLVGFRFFPSLPILTGKPVLFFFRHSRCRSCCPQQARQEACCGSHRHYSSSQQNEADHRNILRFPEWSVNYLVQPTADKAPVNSLVSKVDCAREFPSCPSKYITMFSVPLRRSTQVWFSDRWEN